MTCTDAPRTGAVEVMAQLDRHLARPDETWMQRAITVAEGARNLTRPNPFVGAVVVADGAEVAAAATGRTGTAHAEVRALDLAGDAARGATMFVTLEPCAHLGRTPPCTEALIGAGVTRVVYGLTDPNPQAAGGAGSLAAAGIEVVGGVLADRVSAQLRVFVTAMNLHRPHVTLKLGQTMTGVTIPPETRDESPRRWITGPEARRRVHELRAQVDGILIGSGTALADDPKLTVRDAPPPLHSPRAVIVDRRGRLALDLAVIRPGTVVITCAGADASWRAALAARAVTVVVVADLHEAMTALVDLDITAVLAEPGVTLASSLLAAGLVDRLLLQVASSRVTDPDRPAFCLDTSGMAVTAVRQLGDDVEWDLRPTDAREQQAGPPGERVP